MEIFKGLSGKFLIPYALTMFFGGWTYFTIINIVDYYGIKESLQGIDKLILEVRKDEKDFLAREYKNVDFITTGNSYYLSNLNYLIDSLYEKTNLLRKHHTVSHSKVDSMHLLLNNYSISVNALAAMIQEKGFKDHGLVGQLRRAIHEVENADLRYDKYYMLMLRRHEKDFFLRKDLKYWDKFELGIQDMKGHINVIGRVYPEKVAHILNKIDEYNNRFARVVQLQQRIGLSEKEGLHGELRRAIHELTPFVDEMVASHNRYLDYEIKKNIIALIVLFILIIVTGVIILTVHINKITRNINLIKKSALVLSQGRFPEQSSVNSRDELGQAHEALNTLTIGLQDKTQFARDIGEGRLNTSLETLGAKDILGLSLLKMRNNLSAVTDDINDTLVAVNERGEVNSRISLEGKDKFWNTFSNSINRLLETFCRRMVTIDDIVNAMAKGDLTKQYTESAKGDFKVLANNMNEALRKLNELMFHITINAQVAEESSSEMLNRSDELRDNMNQMATTTTQISQGAQNQVSKVEESSELLGNIQKSFEIMSAHSEGIYDAAKQGVLSSEKGEGILMNVAENMSEISGLSDKTAHTIEALKNRSVEVSNVLKMTNDIAAQTNLLALNASIEAAQAGDAGRGFSVVADEIRKLADDSKISVNEIKELIEAIQSDIKNAGLAIDEMNKSVGAGEVSSRSAKDVFKEISLSSGRTLELSEKISGFTSQQQLEINSIKSLTEDVVVIAEQTAVGTEQMANSTTKFSLGMDSYLSRSERLSKVATSLNEEVTKFKLLPFDIENMKIEDQLILSEND